MKKENGGFIIQGMECAECLSPNPVNHWHLQGAERVAWERRMFCDDVLDAEFILDDILDAEVIE